MKVQKTEDMILRAEYKAKSIILLLKNYIDLRDKICADIGGGNGVIGKVIKKTF